MSAHCVRLVGWVSKGVLTLGSTLRVVSLVQVEDASVLESAWEQAVRIAGKHIKERYPEVVEEVGGRLRGIKRFVAAAEMYKDVDKHKEVRTDMQRVCSRPVFPLIASPSHSLSSTRSLPLPLLYSLCTLLGD